MSFFETFTIWVLIDGRWEKAKEVPFQHPLEGISELAVPIWLEKLKALPQVKAIEVRGDKSKYTCRWNRLTEEEYVQRTATLLADLERQYRALGSTIRMLKEHLGPESEVPTETEGERSFRTRKGPFLYALMIVGGPLSRSDLRKVARENGYPDLRGVMAYLTGSHASLELRYELFHLTERGRKQALAWSSTYGAEAL